MAPELVNKEEYNEKVDIWSVGIITSILLTGNHPFNIPYESAEFFEQQPQLDGLEKYRGGGKLAADFIEKCLEKSAIFRCSAGLLMEHQWFKTM